MRAMDYGLSLLSLPGPVKNGRLLKRPTLLFA